MRVPWLDKREIDLQAGALIVQYENRIGNRLEPPVPVEEIVEHQLGLALGFVDFEARYGLDGILGATFVDQRKILIDTRLLQPGSEGRMSFTCAHEAGHWVLHRHLVREAMRRDAENGAIMCRTGGSRKPIEWQADYFAASLLMPDRCVARAFRDTFGPDPLRVVNARCSFDGPRFFDPCADNWHRIPAAVAQTGGFSNVSLQALYFRLEDLGWVVNETAVRMGWHRAAAGS